MDSKKKQPAKKTGKKQFKNYALLNGIPIGDMTKDQLEAHILQLQQEVEHEREERNYYQLERDKIQLFWEVTKQQLEEKDALLQLKNSDIDEAALTHLAEIKLYKQKMKHIMFECQQYIDEKMKEKMDEKLILEEEHLVQVNHLEDKINTLKDQIFQLKIDNENTIVNQRLQHGEELCSLHQQYQKEIDILKSKEVAEIGKIHHKLDLQREKAIQEIQNKKDAHMEHLIQTHEELFQKMKNYYNDIIKNDILLIKSLKDKIQDSVRKECHYKESIKTLEIKNNVLSLASSDFQQTKARRQSQMDSKEMFYGFGSVIRNLQQELDKLKQENDSLFYQLQRIQQKEDSQKNFGDNLSGKSATTQKKKILKEDNLNLLQRSGGVLNMSFTPNHLCNNIGEDSTKKESLEEYAFHKYSSTNN